VINQRPSDIGARVREAIAAIDATAATRLLEDVVAIPSPTGQEVRLAAHIADRLRSRGIDARVQRLAGEQANVIAELGSEASGPTHLLYGQLDTAFSGDVTRDRVLTGGEERPEFLTTPRLSGDWLSGNGAENPKGYLVAAITAFEALAQTGCLANSRLVLGLCAGGMPSFPGREGEVAAGDRRFGIGCRALLDGIGAVDAAVLGKPGFAVGWQEVGIAIYRIRVAGDLDYTGIRHRSSGTSSVLNAARVVEELEGWFPEYSSAFATTATTPQGAVVAISGGDPERPAFLPASSDIYVDLRVPPGRTLAEVGDALEVCLNRIRATHDVTLTAQLLYGVPGATTDPNHPVVRCAIKAWETMTGQPHQPRSGTSGYTDAVTLRLAGVPTARIGMPRPDDPSPDAARFSMGRVHIPSILTLSEWLVRTLLLLDDDPRSQPPPTNHRQPTPEPNA
jgi:acetylornithine deacetylase/succinyl-diaminopimelate desuccinylase-like protein